VEEVSPTGIHQLIPSSIKSAGLGPRNQWESVQGWELEKAKIMGSILDVVTPRESHLKFAASLKCKNENESDSIS